MGIIVIMSGFYGDNSKENGNYYIGVIYTLLIPFLGTLNIRCCIIIGVQQGTSILTTTHVYKSPWCLVANGNGGRG